MVDCFQQNYFSPSNQIRGSQSIFLPPKLPASLEFFQIFLSPRCHLPTSPIQSAPTSSQPRAPPDLPPTRRQPHPEASPSAASSARRRLPFSSIRSGGSWSPAGVRRPHQHEAVLPPDVVLTVTKPHPRRSHLSPEAPWRVSSLHHPQAAPASCQHLQPPPRQAGDPLSHIPFSFTINIKSIKVASFVYIHLKSLSSSISVSLLPSCRQRTPSVW